MIRKFNEIMCDLRKFQKFLNYVGNRRVQSERLLESKISVARLSFIGEVGPDIRIDIGGFGFGFPPLPISHTWLIRSKGASFEHFRQCSPPNTATLSSSEDIRSADR